MTASNPATAPTRPVRGSVSLDKFVASICPMFEAITKAQVAGIEAKFAAFGAAASPLAYVAYRIAISLHETAEKMQPASKIGSGRGKT